MPYEESIRVPIFVRYDPLTGGTSSSDNDLVANIDVAAAAARRHGHDVAQRPAAGGLRRSDPPGGRRVRAHVEYVPTYCGLRTKRYAYIRYGTGEEEPYDLQSDPYELANLLYNNTDPAVEALRMTLFTRLKQRCSPPPPHYTI